MGKNKKNNKIKKSNNDNNIDIDNLLNELSLENQALNQKSNPKFWIIDYIKEKKNGIPSELEDVLKNALITVPFDEYFVAVGFIEHIKEYFIYQIKLDMNDLENNTSKTQKEEVEELTKFLAPMVEHPYFHICFEAIMEYAILQKIKFENNQFLSQVFYNIMDLTEDRETKFKQWDYLNTIMIFKFNKKDLLVFSNKLMLQRFCSIIGYNNIYIDVLEKNQNFKQDEYDFGIEDMIECFNYLIDKKIIITPLICTNETIRNLRNNESSSITKDNDSSFLRFDLLDFFFLTSFTNTAISIKIMNEIIFKKLNEAIEKENFYVLEQFFLRKVSWYNINILINFSEIPIRAKFPETREIMNQDPFKFTYLDRIIELNKKTKEDFCNFEVDFNSLKNSIKNIQDEKYLKYAPSSFKNRFLQNM
jgi:hypothetical protein